MIYAIYDIKDKERCVGVMSSVAEIAQKFNTTEDAVFKAIRNKRTYQNRYKIERIE